MRNWILTSLHSSQYTSKSHISPARARGLALVMNAHTIYELIDSREFRDIAEPLLDELDIDKLNSGALAYELDPRSV